MTNKIYVVIEKYSHNDYFQVCFMSIGNGCPYVKAVFDDLGSAKAFKNMVSNARQDSEFKIKRMLIK